MKTLVVVLAVVLCFALQVQNAGATVVLPLDLDQIVAGAQRVVHVRCTGNEVEADPVVGVVTITRFDVLERAKGPAHRSLVVRQAGGEMNGLVVDYHVPTFAAGEEYVLFLPASSSLNLASPVGLSQGVFYVESGRAGKEVGNGRDFTELLAATDAATVPPGMSARLKLAPQERKRMQLSDFMTLVRAKSGKQ